MCQYNKDQNWFNGNIVCLDALLNFKNERHLKPYIINGIFLANECFSLYEKLMLS